MTYTAVIQTIPEDAFFDEYGDPVEDLDWNEMRDLSEHRFADLDEAARVTIERLTAARAECQDQSYLGAIIVVGEVDDLRARCYGIEEKTNGSFEFDASGPY
jgi:hypothetical protein